MSRRAIYFFVLHQGLSNDKNTWSREYLKLTLGGRRDALEKITECEDKTIWRHKYTQVGLPFGVVRSSAADYMAALLRFRRDHTARKLKAEQEREARKLADQKLAGVRGMGPRPAAPVPAPTPAPIVEDEAPAANPFDDFTVVDTEYQGQWLLEVAAIRYKNWQPVGQFVSYVRCTEWIGPYTTTLTGITQEHVRQAPPEKEVLQRLLALAGDSLLVAHNVAADRSKLKLARERQGATTELPNKWFCTLQLARARLPKYVKCGLGQLCERFGFSRRGHHQALTDVQMCFQILRHFHEQAPLRSLDPKARTATPTLDFAA